MPHERINFVRKLQEGETIPFAAALFTIGSGTLPDNCLLTNPALIQGGRLQVGRYLWIVDEEGLKLILEQTPNPTAERGIVCHTNITGGKPAFQGGELWFGIDNVLYINFKSGRYGAITPEHELAVLDYFRSLSFDVAEV